MKPLTATLIVITGSLKEDMTSSLLRISYTQCDRHSDGANYIFADDHAKWYHVERTLDSNNFLWGKRVYSQGNVPVYKQDGSGPVQ